MSGDQCFITNAPAADLFVVFARTRSANTFGHGETVFRETMARFDIIDGVPGLLTEPGAGRDTSGMRVQLFRRSAIALMLDRIAATVVSSPRSRSATSRRLQRPSESAVGTTAQAQRILSNRVPPS